MNVRDWHPPPLYRDGVPRPTLRSTLRFAVLFSLLVLATPAATHAQSAAIAGRVVDEREAPVAGATLTLDASDRGVRRQTTSDDDGRFVFAAVSPGTYRLRTTLAGTGATEASTLQVTTQAQVAVLVRLRAPAVQETVDVVADARPVTTSPSTGRVVPGDAIRDLPLNGRSFHALLELTPGVTLVRSGTTTFDGQFSVNGQRTNANDFTVDGVSANTAINPRSSLVGESGTGSLPALSVLGTTTSLVAVDAVEEFRVQTSSMAPEYGRVPGGHVAITSRAGSNRLRGTAFEYFRDDALDATDWFANSRGLPKAALRQHDFGGTLGGPLRRDRVFFFVSHESLRLDLPQTVVTAVPSDSARAAAPATTRPLLDAFPQPTGAALAAGTSEFAAAYSDPARLDATSVRGDLRLGASSVFGRASWAPSRVTTRTLNRLAEVRASNTSLTVGGTRPLTDRLVLDVRANWTGGEGESRNRVDTFGGAQPLPTAQLFPGFLSPGRDNAIVSLGALTYRDGQQTDNTQTQAHVLGSATWVRGGHQVKAGVDFRRLTPTITSNGLFQLVFANVAQASAGVVTQAIVNVGASERQARLDWWSAYLQDTWQASPRLSLTFGLRWDHVPPPGESSGQPPAVVLDARDQAAMRLAPAGTAVWDLGAGAFAPRVGGAYTMRATSGRELVVRGGAGLFHNTALGPVGNVYGVFPYSRQQIVRGVAYPAIVGEVVAPSVDREPPYGQIWTYAEDLELPRVWQWNATVEQALGGGQSVSVSYVGARGQALLRTAQTFANPAVNPRFGSVVNLVENSGRSTYHALQAQWQGRVRGALRGLAAYTLAEARDNTSADSSTLAGQSSGTAAPGTRLDPDDDWGAADFDVRHQFSAGLSFDYTTTRAAWWARVLDGFGIDALVRLRSGTPLTVVSPVDIGFGFYSFRPDLVPGVPVWIDDRTVAGGRRLNRDAFTVPAGRQGTLQRNVLRGFGASQVDLSLRRSIRLGLGNARVQLRAEWFNVLNTPNFADPQVNLLSPQFGTSTQMLGRGLGGLNPLYQIGGPRSAQIAARLDF